jgi:2-polyprenyl-3-methyl-5-hydroxy-6-metoxy-1,4-benzoquinol methylase
MLKNYKEKNDQYYAHTRHELLPYVPKSLRFALDIGCGRGNFGQLLKQYFNCEVWGIEPEPHAALEASKVLDHVFNTVFDKNTTLLASQKFDGIFFNDVLEHLAEPDEALLLAKKYLTPGGRIIASIPNIRFYPVMLSLLRYKDFKYLDAGVMDKTHLRFFTEKSMVRMFEACGFYIELIEGINRHDSFKYLNLLNRLLFGTLNDMKNPQFVVVASIKN